MKMEKDPLVIKTRMEIILAEHGGEMTVEDFCKEHVRRGWALPSFSPPDLGCEPTDTIRWTRKLN